MRAFAGWNFGNYGYYLLPITYYLFLRNSFAFHKKKA